MDGPSLDSHESQSESGSGDEKSDDELKIIEGVTIEKNKQKKKKKSKLTAEELQKKLELEKVC